MSDIGKMIDDSIDNIPKIYPHILVDKYVIMPNHVHMILRVGTAESGRQIAAPTPTVQTVIGNMKRHVSMQCGYSIWQKSFHEHIIRNEDEYRQKWQYIDNNPAKWAEDDYFVKK